MKVSIRRPDPARQQESSLALQRPTGANLGVAGNRDIG